MGLKNFLKKLNIFSNLYDFFVEHVTECSS
jgi:hypothetical protein